jgi:hypothetical protein
VQLVVRIGRGIDLGWVIAAVGVGLEVVGWYQVSGQPTEAQQLPYLASATIPGAALIVAAAVLIAGRQRVETRGSAQGAYAPNSALQRAGLWALPDGSYVHRADCPLIDGKPEAFQVTGAAADDGTGRVAPTTPCPICQPDLVAVAQ